MKFELQRLPEYSDDAILVELRRVAATVGSETLSIAEFSRHSRVSVSTLRRRFGGWPEALAAAGIGQLLNEVTPASKSRVLARTMSDDDIIVELRRVAAILKKTTLTADEIRENAILGVDAVRHRFGTLKAALENAGLSTTSSGRRYTEDECFDNLLAVWTYYGRPPMHDEMKKVPSTVGPKAYIVRWGTWNHALAAFVDCVNSDIDEPEQPIAVPSPITSRPAKSRQEDKQKIKLGLRYRILVRDNFKCVLCGTSPALTTGCRLHVDHFIPWSKGGKTIEQNLRTLCEQCNLGKGATLEPEQDVTIRCNGAAK
jgi:Homing endonuclease associated repeat/HNH endonuclease